MSVNGIVAKKDLFVFNCLGGERAKKEAVAVGESCDFDTFIFGFSYFVFYSFIEHVKQAIFL